jgi:hypothetical protein
MRILRHDPLEPGSIQPLELVQRNRVPHTLYFGSREWDHVGITVHETDPLAISNHLNNITREQRALSISSIFPCERLLIKKPISSV